MYTTVIRILPKRSLYVHKSTIKSPKPILALPSRVLEGYRRERINTVLDDHRLTALDMALGMTVQEPHAGIVAPAPEDEPRARRPGGRGREGVPQLGVDEVEGARVGRLGLGHVGPGEGAHALAEDVEVAPVDVYGVRRAQRRDLQDVVHPHAARGVRDGVVVLAAGLGAQQEGAEVLCFQGQDGLVERPVDDLAADDRGQLVSQVCSPRKGIWEVWFERVGVEDLDVGRGVLTDLVDVWDSRLCRLILPENLKIKERVGKDHLGVSGTRNPHRVLLRLRELGENRVPLPVVDLE